MRRRQAQRGQTLVELVALVPFVVLLALIGWQIAVAAYSWTLADGAARAGARAAEVGAPVGDAVRAALPPRYAAGAVVAGGDGSGPVEVRLTVPRVIPFLPPGHVRAGSGDLP